MNDSKKVVIVGAGIAGLTAATLLAEAGLKVTILEADNQIGGQAKSGRTQDEFPTEHSLRVYHDHYLCYFEMLRRINFNEKTSFENLTSVSLCLDKKSAGELFIPKGKKFSSSIFRIHHLFRFIYFLWSKCGFRLKEIYKLLKADLLYIFSEERFNDKTHNKNVCELFDIAEEDKALHETFISFLTIAAGVREASSGKMACELFSACKPHYHFYMMNGPTSERVFDAWHKYLENLGVEIITDSRVEDFEVANNKISTLLLENGKTITADDFVFAVSVLQIKDFVENGKLASFLNNISPSIFNSEWSNGAQFYLTELPQPKSNSNLYKPGVIQVHLDSPWKIVSIIQGNNFWENVAFPEKCNYILSVCLSQIDIPGVKYNKPAWECSLEEIKEEILLQCDFTSTKSVIGWQLDENIQFMDNESYQVNKKKLPPHLAHQQRNGAWILNFSPLFTPNPDFYLNTPQTKTKLDNLFLAGQYCQTVFCIPTMEKASESGFHAAIALCEKYNVKKPKLPFKDFNHRDHSVTRVIDSYWYPFIKKMFK